MATADEILAAAMEAEADKTLVIDNDLRTITIPPSVTSLGVESDADVHRLHFRMPSTYGDIDLSKFNIRINFMNAKGTGDIYQVKDAATADGSITFSWLVGRSAVAYKGAVRFIVCLKQKDNAGKVTKEFNTTLATLPVLEGLETGEQVVQENPDIIEAILTRLDDIAAGAVSDEQIAAAVASYLERNPNAAGSTASIGTVELLAAKWVGSGNLYSQVVSIAGVTENSQVDLTPSVEQLVVFYEKDLTFVTENDGGTVSVYAIGQKPENDYTIQVTITEVSA